MTLFNKDYNPDTMPIIHKDGNINNCSLDNLYANTPLNILKDIYSETKRWEKVILEDTKLYYDYWICEDGRLYNGTTNSFLKPFMDNREEKTHNGYLRYNLYIGKRVTDIIHVSAAKLVALHFLKRPEGKDIVVYKDGDFKNIDISNLYWGDRYDVFNKELQNSREFCSLYFPIFGEEKWKELDIGIEFEDEYLVSNFGRIYNKTKSFYSSIRNGSYSNLNNQYYKFVSLNTKFDGFKTFSVHRLVAFMFIKNTNPETKTCVNHINGNPECNFAFNLEWCTPMENVHHAIQSNLFHSAKYDGKVNDTYWRLNTFYAWVYTIKDITDESAYSLYQKYIENYKDDLPILSYDEFIKIKKDKEENDKDYKLMKKFYDLNYFNKTIK